MTPLWWPDMWGCLWSTPFAIIALYSFWRALCLAIKLYVDSHKKDQP